MRILLEGAFGIFYFLGSYPFRLVEKVICDCPPPAKRGKEQVYFEVKALNYSLLTSK